MRRRAIARTKLPRRTSAPACASAVFDARLDNANQLDVQEKLHLAKVRAAAQRMAQLIDDLLALSRVTRQDLHHAHVDLTRLAHKVAERRRAREPGRDVEFVIADGLTAEGDSRLLEIVPENLLGNAWKFTARRECGRVEFGQRRDRGHAVFFVRDNGAGFDMTYAEKLFGVFQRLHSVDEFEGTGIGPATVQCVIHRHGGRVWAEDAVGQGATFYFYAGGRGGRCMDEAHVAGQRRYYVKGGAKRARFAAVPPGEAPAISLC